MWDAVPCVELHRGICWAPPCSSTVTVSMEAAAGDIVPPNSATEVSATAVYTPVQLVKLQSVTPSTTGTQFDFSAEFSTDVTGLSADDFTVQPASAIMSKSLIGSGASYTLQVTLQDTESSACSAACPAGYVHSNDAVAYCVKATPTLNWAAAESFCAPYHLATVNSEERVAFLKSRSMASAW